MKHVVLVVLSFLFISSFAQAQRSQDMQSKTVKTASEIRTSNFMTKLSSKVQLTQDQYDDMAELIRDYLDESQNMIGNETQARNLARLELKRDNKARKILKTDEAYNEYVKAIEELKMQMGRGYGRK